MDTPLTTAFLDGKYVAYDSLWIEFAQHLERRAAAWAKSARKWRSTARYQGRHITSIQEELASCCSAEELRQVREDHTLLQRDFEQQRCAYQRVVQELAAIKAEHSETEWRCLRTLGNENRKLTSDLARVTAEREAQHLIDASMALSLENIGAELSALRARNAELEQKASDWEASANVYRGGETLKAELLAQAEQLNAELVAESAKLRGIVRAAYLHCLDNCALDDVEAGKRLSVAEQRQLGKDLANYGCLDALARAESPTPATHPDTVRLDHRAIQLMTYNQQNGEWEPTIFEDVDLRAAIDAATKEGGK